MQENIGIKIVIRHAASGFNDEPLFAEAFNDSLVTIGSDPVASLPLQGYGIAPEHVVILNEADQPLLINREPDTILNGESLPREARRSLSPGDELRIGDYVINFVADDEQAEAQRNGAQLPLSSSDAQPEPPLSSEDRAAADVPRTQPPVSAGGNTIDAEYPADAGSRHPRPAAISKPQSFAAILDSLRTEEDSFYFLIDGGAQAGARLLIEQDEVPLGWDETKQNLSHEPGHVAIACAVVRKDWSGVVVQAQGGGRVTVNGEPVNTARRLRDGDRVELATSQTAAPDQALPHLIFHEPASLLVLDSLLPRRLPPPVASSAASNATTATSLSSGAANVGASGVKGGSLPATAATVSTDAVSAYKPRGAARRYLFGVFTRLDLIVLLIGTLAATLVVYLILRFLS